MSVVLAIDAGTTGVRTRAVHSDGRPSISAYQEFPQHFPRPGWVEHDADDIWNAVMETLVEVISSINEAVAAIGVGFFVVDQGVFGQGQKAHGQAGRFQNALAKGVIGHRFALVKAHHQVDGVGAHEAPCTKLAACAMA